MILKNISDTHKNARLLAKKIKVPSIIYLSGELGAGKTEWVRGFIRAYLKDPKLIVSSPSYSLINTYQKNGKKVVHMDLYRLQSQDDLESLGVRDYLKDTKNIICVEWSELIQEDMALRDQYFLDFKFKKLNQRELSSLFKARHGS